MTRPAQQIQSGFQRWEALQFVVALAARGARPPGEVNPVPLRGNLASSRNSTLPMPLLEFRTQAR